MNSIKKMALVTGIFSLGYFAFQLFAQQTPGGGGNTCSTTLQDVTNTDGTHSFDLTCLPALESSTTTGNAPFWRVFFSLGDGRFWLGTLNDFKAQRFALNTVSDPHSMFVEYHAAYDDKRWPKRTVRNDSVGVTPEITAADPLYLRIQNGANRLVKLQSTLSPIPGKNLIYLITYQGTSTTDYTNAEKLSIDFKFNGSILQYQGYEGFGGEQVNYSISQDIGMVNITNNANKPGNNNQRTVFLFFKVADNAVVTGSPMNPAPTVQYNAILAGNASPIDADNSLSAQALTSSIDPSYKIILDSLWSYDDATKRYFSDYKILIQNEGTRRVDKITVEDILDPLYDSIAFTPSAVSKPQDQDSNPMAAKFPPKLDPAPVKNNRHYCYIDYINLRGLREPDFGRTFTEKETKTSLFLRCFVKKGINPLEQYPCNAVCNQANVYFECNPKHKTNLSIKPIPCNPNNGKCASVSDSIILTQVPANGQPLLPADKITELKLEGYSRYKWYPALGLSDPFVLNPNYTLADQEEYTLVASAAKSCKQKILHVKLPLCKLGFEVKEICDHGVLYLEATAQNYSGNGQQLKWNNCRYGPTNKFQIYPNTNQYYYLGVSDTTGCTAETTFYISRASDCTTSDFWETVILSVIGTVLVIMAGVVVYNALNNPKGVG
ncbi:MAG: hypothetical protein KGS48_17525 [Bacteroidetes bacterium]|nr:hypothetical protein [Bacteroidota bacterium]